MPVLVTDAWTCAFCPDAIPDDGSCDPLSEHYDARHNPLRPPVPEIDLNGPGQDWHTRAMTAVRQFARSGNEFTMYQVSQIAGEPANPKSDWGTFAREVNHLKIASPVRFAKSDRPTSKGSALNVWRGIPATQRKAA